MNLRRTSIVLDDFPGNFPLQDGQDGVSSHVCLPETVRFETIG